MDVHFVRQKSMIILRVNQCVKGLLCGLIVEKGTSAPGREVFHMCSRLACTLWSFTVRAPVYYATTSQYDSSVVLLFLHFGGGKGNKQKCKAKFKDAPPPALLISVQSSPGPLLPPDEWRRRVGVVLVLGVREVREEAEGAAIAAQVRRWGSVA